MLPHLAFPKVELLQYDGLTRSKTWATLQFGDQLDGWRELKTTFSKNGTITVSNGESSLSFQVPATSLEANDTHVLLRGAFDAWFDFESLERGIKITIFGNALSATSYPFTFLSTFQKRNYTLWSGSVGFSFEDAKNLEWSITKTSLSFAVDGKFSIDPSLVDNSTSLYAVATPQQRGQFYGSGYHYFFYTNGTNFGFRSSSDGNTWGLFVDCPTSGNTNYANRFDVCYSNDTSKVAYTICNITAGSDLNRLWYRQGSLDGSGGITWDTTEQLVYSVITSTYTIFAPSISYCAGGYPWISFRIAYYEGIVLQRIYLTSSNMKNGTWSLRSGFPVIIASITTSAYGFLLPQTIGLGENVTAVVYYMFQATSDLKCRIWNVSLGAVATITSGDVFSLNCWSACRQGFNIGVTYQSTNATYYPYFYLRNYTSSGWSSREMVYNVALYAGTAPIISANDTCWFVSWCRESPRQIHYRIRNDTGSWLPDVDTTYYSLGDNYGAPNSDFTDYVSLQSSFFCYGNYLSFGYQYTVVAVMAVICVRYAFLDFNVVTQAWHDIATWTATLQTRQWVDIFHSYSGIGVGQLWSNDLITRQWIDVSTWTESLITRQWNVVSTWALNLQTRLWREMATWQQDPITRMWHETTWLADLIITGWHDIALWTLTLNPSIVPYIIPILFLGSAIAGILFIGLYWKKKS